MKKILHKNEIHPTNSQPLHINTLDIAHNNILTQIHNVESTVIPEMTAELAQLKERARSLPTTRMDEFLELRDRIKSIQHELKHLRTLKKNYLLNNSKYVFEYFEQKKQISVDSNTTNQNKNALNSFFKVKPTNKDNTDLSNNQLKHTRKNYQNYWRNVSNDLPNIQEFVIPTDICNICMDGELIPQDEEGILICNNPKCSKFITYIVDSSKPTNKEPPNEVSYTAYIRLNHFKEILSQFQAKETTLIPEEVLTAIKQRIKKERIKDPTTINYDKMREILRKLGYNKYFEHIQYINSLFGIKPPIMNEELHETLCVLFIEIQQPWAVHCPPNRTNFFNYTYTLYQLCVLLDQTQYLPFIPMMKDREKQLEQDMIWKKVCHDLDWEYFPTV
jgi:hypothetical protein